MSRRSLPSPAMVVASLALFIALGGTGYAATQIGTDAHAAKPKVRKGPRGPRGPRGAQGPQGPQGPAGPAGPTAVRAFAEITPNEEAGTTGHTSVVAAHSKGITNAMVTNGTVPTIYCIHDLGFTPTNVQVTPRTDVIGSTVEATLNPAPLACPGGSIQVVARNGGAATAQEGFFISIYG